MFRLHSKAHQVAPACHLRVVLVLIILTHKVHKALKVGHRPLAHTPTAIPHSHSHKDHHWVQVAIIHLRVLLGALQEGDYLLQVVADQMGQVQVVVASNRKTLMHCKKQLTQWKIKAYKMIHVILI